MVLLKGSLFHLNKSGDGTSQWHILGSLSLFYILHHSHHKLKNKAKQNKNYVYIKLFSNITERHQLHSLRKSIHVSVVIFAICY